MDAKTLVERAAAKSAQTRMTGHSKSAGPLAFGLRTLARAAPGVERAIGGAARGGARLWGKALKAKPKTTLLGTGLGGAALNDAASYAGLPSMGKWDPAAHAEQIDPRLTGGSTGSNLKRMVSHPLQTLLAMTGNAGSKAPVSIGGSAGPRSKPTDIRFGPDGKIIGTSTSDVNVDLSPAAQYQLSLLQNGMDPTSQLQRAFEAEGLSTGSLLTGRKVPSANKPRAYADPAFLRSTSNFSRPIY